MAATVREIRRKAAKRPAPRTVTFTVDSGEFEGWAATIRADFPANILAGLESGSIALILAAMDKIIVDHNMPNDQDEIAERLEDVDPYDGLLVVVTGLTDQLSKLPSR